jgi:outer membrane protein assembly factor BamB
VLANQKGQDITRCLDAATGKEIWQDQYDAELVKGIAGGRAGEFVGPRSSPTVADGKVVTLGQRGTLSCLDAATGKKLWRKDDIKGLPRFFTSSSPLITNGLCIAQLGGQDNGAVVAYDLATGTEKWKWAGDGTAYASPVLLTLDGARVLVAETDRNIVGIDLAGGKLLWKTPFAVTRGGGRGGQSYNAATPMVDGQTVIFSGNGRATKAVRIEKQGDEFMVKELWSNTENTVQFNTPVLKNGLIFGLTVRDNLFCLSAKDGKTLWSTQVSGKNGFGSIVDVGPALLLLTPSGKLIVFQPSDKEFKQLATYKVADGDTYAYPIAAGNRIFVRDRDSLTLWTVD